MKRLLLILCLVFCFALVGGCFWENYSIQITGFYTSPKVVLVNHPTAIYLRFTGNVEGSIIKQYHWKIDGFAEEFITEGNGINGVIFSTSGAKNVTVYVTANDKDFKSNIFQFVIDVEEAQ